MSRIFFDSNWFSMVFFHQETSEASGIAIPAPSVAVRNGGRAEQTGGGATESGYFDATNSCLGLRLGGRRGLTSSRRVSGSASTKDNCAGWGRRKNIGEEPELKLSKFSAEEEPWPTLVVVSYPAVI
jgi:hypothetical protein